MLRMMIVCRRTLETAIRNPRMLVLVVANLLLCYRNSRVTHKIPVNSLLWINKYSHKYSHNLSRIYKHPKKSKILIKASLDLHEKNRGSKLISNLPQKPQLWIYIKSIGVMKLEMYIITQTRGLFNQQVYYTICIFLTKYL